MEIKDKIVKVINYFNNPINGYEFSLENEKVDKQVENFCKRLHGKYDILLIDYYFLFDYFAFQYQYWYTKEIKETFQIGWLIGNKALQRFRNRDLETYRYFYKTQLLRDYKLSLQNFKEINFLNQKINLNFTEEIEKQRYHNQDSGLANCIEKTSLFHPKSKWCQTCNMKEDCKELLKANYKKLYKSRINGEIQ